MPCVSTSPSARSICDNNAVARSHRMPPVQYIITFFPRSFSFVSGAFSHLGNSREFRIIGSRNSAPPGGGSMRPMFHRVILVRLHVLRGVLSQQRRALAAEAVRHELLRGLERQRLELRLSRDAVRELEVRVVEELRIPRAKPLAERARALRGRGERAVHALERDPPAAGDVVQLREPVELRERLLLSPRAPHGLDVLIEQNLRDALGRRRRRERPARDRARAGLDDLLALGVLPHPATRPSWRFEDRPRGKDCFRNGTPRRRRKKKSGRASNWARAASGAHCCP
eukprot:29835-Pelagococcus_subviridis.AAC.15